MPLTLRCFLYRAVSAGIITGLTGGVMIYVHLTEDAVPLVVFLAFLLPASGFTLYSSYRYIALRRAFAGVSPKRGLVRRRVSSLWVGCDRLVIACDGQEYTTSALFFSGESAAWVGCDVDMAIGSDGYVFIFKIRR